MEITHISIVLSLVWYSCTGHRTECGMKKSSSRIVGGRDSGGYHYPWFALLVLKDKENVPVCAGSLITTRHVLTAAHCFTIKPYIAKENLFSILMGVYDRCNQYEQSRQKFGVSEVYVHEEYNHETKFHDIAVMTLERQADYTTVCLPIRGSSDTTEPAFLIGFGVTREGERKAPCHMMEADIIKYSKSDCKNTDLPEEDIGEPTVICAGNIAGGIDSCQGDSGGPLHTVTPTGKYVIAGIVSYGYGCANPGLPGIYTDVASYLNWIESKITKDNSMKNYHEKFYNRSWTLHKSINISVSPVQFPHDNENNGSKVIMEKKKIISSSSSANVKFPTEDHGGRPLNYEDPQTIKTILFPRDKK